LIAISFTSTSISSSIFFSGLYVVGTPITVSANKVNLVPGQEIALKCTVTEYPDTKFDWYKRRVYPFIDKYDESPIELVKNDDRYSIDKNVLIIKSSTIEDVGDYFCRVKEPQDGIVETETMISVRPKPYIEEFALESSTLRSATVEDGKLLKISCNVVDDYSSPDNITIKWQMSKYDEGDMDEVIAGEDGIRLEVRNRTSQDLIIDRVTKDHRRLYRCHASNGITENSKSILIRVKNRYLATWPAVGIIIELVILIGVICFVENRKVEPDKGAYDRKAIQM